MQYPRTIFFLTATALICVGAVSGCTSAQIASTEALASKYQADVTNACSKVSADAADPLAVLVAASVPAVAQAVALTKSACGTEEAVAALVLSPLSVAWLGTLDTTITSKGAIVLPAPVAPKP